MFPQQGAFSQCVSEENSYQMFVEMWVSVRSIEFVVIVVLVSTGLLFWDIPFSFNPIVHC